MSLERGHRSRAARRTGAGESTLYELLLTRPCVWLDANADVLCLVLTNAFVVPTISAHTKDGQAPYHMVFAIECLTKEDDRE